jgi:anti-sigma factor RsiW
MSTDCSQFSDRSADYLLGEMDSADSAAFESHMLACPRCEEILLLTREVIDELVTQSAKPPALRLSPAVSRSPD